MNSGNTVGYFHDGYTADGYIAGVDRLYPSVRFRFRPVLTQNRAVIDSQMPAGGDPRKSETLAATVICAQLESWDMQKPKTMGSDELVAIELEASEVLRIPPALMNRLYRVVMGIDPPDEDPEASDDKRDNDAAEDIQAALAGMSPEDAAAKNS